jgi:hypothetical protein
MDRSISLKVGEILGVSQLTIYQGIFHDRAGRARSLIMWTCGGHRIESGTRDVQARSKATQPLILPVDKEVDKKDLGTHPRLPPLRGSELYGE